MMRIEPKHILQLQSIKGFGNIAVKTILDELSKLHYFDDKIIYELMNTLSANKRLKSKVPLWVEFQNAVETAEHIVDKSAEIGINMISIYDAGYPPILHTTVSEFGKSEVPILIHYLGNIGVCGIPSISVIGTREPTESGKLAGEYFGSEFASRGVNIVSGLALGCDSAGHRGALKVNGSTTAVLAGGLDNIFPKENVTLAEAILLGGGLLVSENPIGTPTSRYNLVARDRIQAGLSDASLVVQTTVNGGTMHAARATLASGKPLFVVEYKDSTSDKIKGNLFLKTKGAIGISSSSFKADPQLYLDKLSRR